MNEEDIPELIDQFVHDVWILVKICAVGIYNICQYIMK
jgi:hypothetical protein